MFVGACAAARLPACWLEPPGAELDCGCDDHGGPSSSGCRSRQALITTTPKPSSRTSPLKLAEKPRQRDGIASAAQRTLHANRPTSKTSLASSGHRLIWAAAGPPQQCGPGWRKTHTAPTTPAPPHRSRTQHDRQALPRHATADQQGRLRITARFRWAGGANPVQGTKTPTRTKQRQSGQTHDEHRARSAPPSRRLACTPF
jgi:hypothetical protein